MKRHPVCRFARLHFFVLGASTLFLFHAPIPHLVSLVSTTEPLLITEVCVTPTWGEFVEIYNPNSFAFDLSNVFLTDATYSPGSEFYYKIVTGSDYGGGDYGDFHARFPDGAVIGPRKYQTIAMAGSDNFMAIYGIGPTYELYDDGLGYGEQVMREAVAGSINGQGSLTNTGEVVILYFWDEGSDLVLDLDYFLWGDKDEAVDKTGVAIDGPDWGLDASAYQNDTAISSQAVCSLGSHTTGYTWQRRDFNEGNETKTGGNGASGHNETSEDLDATWIESEPSPNSAFIAYVSIDGLCDGHVPCSSTIQGGVNTSVDDFILKVATDSYSGNIGLHNAKTITLQLMGDTYAASSSVTNAGSLQITGGTFIVDMGTLLLL